jgi:anti-sigma B factor antagonist
MEASMECVHEDSADGVRIIRLAGRMDIEGSEEIAVQFTTLTVSGGSAIIVDLSGLDFIASLGIGALVTAARTVKSRRGVLALCGARSNVSSALMRTNLPAIIPTCATLDEARALVATPAGP